MNEWGDDFMSKPKKQKKPNNLLQLISNEDLKNISNHIMKDINKAKERIKAYESDSDSSKNQYEEDKCSIIDENEESKDVDDQDEEEVIFQETCHKFEFIDKLCRSSLN